MPVLRQPLRQLGCWPWMCRARSWRHRASGPPVSTAVDRRTPHHPAPPPLGAKPAGRRPSRPPYAGAAVRSVACNVGGERERDRTDWHRFHAHLPATAPGPQPFDPGKTSPPIVRCWRAWNPRARRRRRGRRQRTEGERTKKRNYGHKRRARRSEPSNAPRVVCEVPRVHLRRQQCSRACPSRTRRWSRPAASPTTSATRRRPRNGSPPARNHRQEITAHDLAAGVADARRLRGYAPRLGRPRTTDSHASSRA